MAIDKEKNVYVVGLTNSNFGFPISESAYEKNNDDAVDVGFLLKLDINKERKDALLYGTYFGGNDSTSFSALAVDDNGYVYVTGVTQSKDFPVTQNAYETKFEGGLSSAFISKFNLNKTGKESLIYSSFLCGDGEEAGYGIAVDSRECAYITGVTNSLNNFPITQNAFQNSISNIEGSGFLIKVNTQLSGEKGLAYGSYIDGNGSDVCSDIKIDYNNYVYICGFTTSTDFPVNSYENGWVKNGYNSFLLKLDLNKERRKALLLGTFLRKNINDFALGLALDNELNTYITGYAHSISEDRSKEKEGYYEESSISIMKVSTRICNLSIEKSQYNIDVEPGGKTQYEINIINNGPDVATDIRITDVLGRGITVKEISVSKYIDYDILDHTFEGCPDEVQQLLNQFKITSENTIIMNVDDTKNELRRIVIHFSDDDEIEKHGGEYAMKCRLMATLKAFGKIDHIIFLKLPRGEKNIKNVPEFEKTGDSAARKILKIIKKVGQR